MACYIVIYDVHDASRIKKVEDLLKKYNGQCAINDVSWAILSDKKASEIRDEIMALLVAPDRLFVIRSGTEAAWYRPYSDKHSEWLKKNL